MAVKRRRDKLLLVTTFLIVLTLVIVSLICVFEECAMQFDGALHIQPMFLGAFVVAAWSMVLSVVVGACVFVFLMWICGDL